MSMVAALPTRDDLRAFVRDQLCQRDHLDIGQTPFFEAPITRAGKICGFYFEIQGPRLVCNSAIWASEEHRLLFYDSGGERFAEVRLSEAPDPAQWQKSPTRPQAA